MPNKERIIQITGDHIALTPDFDLPWSKTNLPWQHFSIHPKNEFFWKIAIKSFNSIEGSMTVAVIDYYPVDTKNFFQQKMKTEVLNLHFEMLDWACFEAFLSTFKKEALLPFIIDSDNHFRPDLTVNNYHYKIKAYFKDAKFKLGYISLWTSLPALGESVELRVNNSHLLPEFEFIKSYFSNALNRKTYDIDVHLTMLGAAIKDLKCRSKQIDAINDQLIVTLKNTRVLGLQSTPKITVVDKHLFTADELFDQLYDEPVGNIFGQNPADIISTLTGMGAVRNRKQLEYLAGRKQQKDQKILITLAPYFGFLFVVSGQKQHHFIWELINSHATYIWSFDKGEDSIESQIGKIEQVIGIIRDMGRDKYKQFYQLDMAEQEYLFRSITHKHADAGIVDSFPKWRYRLEEVLE